MPDAVTGAFSTLKPLAKHITPPPPDMKIRFPFAVKQIDSNVVEVLNSKDGHPLVEINLHPSLRDGSIKDEVMDKMYDDVLETIVKETIKIERDDK